MQKYQLRKFEYYVLSKAATKRFPYPHYYLAVKYNTCRVLMLGLGKNTGYNVNGGFLSYLRGWEKLKNFRRPEGIEWRRFLLDIARTAISGSHWI